jgi:predicted ribosome quality control (RQC) complex YloA/Tae2 family protein
MHRNYFIFERQVTEINKTLSGAVLQSCFTYLKEELVLHFDHPTPYFLRIGLNLQRPYLLLTPVQRIRDPRTEFFGSLQGMTLADIHMLPYDKRMILDFNGYSLQAIFYGKHPNVILHDPGGSVVSSFKKQLGDIASENSLPLVLPDKITAGHLMDAVGTRPHMELVRILSHVLAGFNLQLAGELCLRSDLPAEMTSDRLTREQSDRLVSAVKTMLSEFKTHTPVIYREKSGNLTLSICTLHALEKISVKDEFPGLNEAWERYIYLSEKVHQYEKQYQKACHAVDRRLTFLQRTHRQMADAKDLAERKEEATLKGKLLQAFASEIEQGQRNVTLPNIFIDESEKIEIKLNPLKSVQENAQIYFQKYKDSRSRDDQLHVKLDTIEDEIREMHEISAKLQTRPPQGRLDKILTDLENRHLVQPESDTKKSDTAFIYSFNRLLLDKKWEVLIGKSAANNDLLTFKFSRKFDLWFHAQSVPGSHVVIRLPNRNEHPPRSVIEEAAAIAAYNSAARNSGLVPVNYTEIRYVRKPRKAPPGQVLISNEKTLFVKPRKLG